MLLKRGYALTFASGTVKEIRFLARILTLRHYVRCGHGFRWRTRHLFDKKRACFPSGVLSYVQKRAGSVGIKIKLKDERTPPSFTREFPSGMDLYEYQKEAVSLALDKTNGIWAVTTGGGKTEQAIALALMVSGNVLFVVDEKYLLRQAAKRWEKYSGTKAGVVGDGEFSPKRFTVATVQTLHRNRKDPLVKSYLESVACLILDECHILGGKSVFSVALAASRAYWRIGMSATPSGRADSLDAYIRAATGDVLTRISLQDLAYGQGDKKRLAVPRVAIVRCRGRVEGAWPEIYEKAIVHNKRRNRLVCDVAVAALKPSLVFYERIEHGPILSKMLNRMGVAADYIYGQSTSKEREESKKRLEEGDIDVLIVSRIFNKGVDIKSVRSCINAAGFKAEIPAIQKLGRGTRLTKGKRIFQYFDFEDRQHHTLLEHSRDRQEVYKGLGVAVKSFDDAESAARWAGRKFKRLKIVEAEND